MEPQEPLQPCCHSNLSPWPSPLPPLTFALKAPFHLFLFWSWDSLPPPLPSPPNPSTATPPHCKAWGVSRGRALCGQGKLPLSIGLGGPSAPSAGQLQLGGGCRDPPFPHPTLSLAWSRKDQSQRHRDVLLGAQALKTRMQAQGKLMVLPLRMSELEGRGSWDHPCVGTDQAPQ